MRRLSTSNPTVQISNCQDWFLTADACNIYNHARAARRSLKIFSRIKNQYQNKRIASDPIKNDRESWNETFKCDMPSGATTWVAFQIRPIAGAAMYTRAC